jgi:hypothetical protein
MEEQTYLQSDEGVGEGEVVKVRKEKGRYEGDVHCNVARGVSYLGGGIKDLSKACGVCEDTIHNWFRSHVKFRECWLEGKEAADGKVAIGLYKRACGYVKKKAVVATYNGVVSDIQYVDEEVEPDVGAAKYWLSNRAKDKWGEGNDASSDVKKLIDIIGKIQDNTQGNSQVKKAIVLDSQTGEEV